MPPPALPAPQPDAFLAFHRRTADALRAGDRPPASAREWATRAADLRTRIRAAIGPFPEATVPLEPETLGEIGRPGYSIRKLVFRTLPDVWMTASLYVPDNLGSRRAPAALHVHGHWPFARRDPVVQRRCLALVKLGFVCLAVDAFGSGERYTAPARGTYHGALYGATLWPAGQTLMGIQAWENHRAVDYLATRPEVDPERIGITGASGGGNQTMLAGALDERLKGVVPVCSVGNYRSYLGAACCVCEVMPGALTFTEEGDVLGLVAPRHLMVISASQDSVQFSPAEAAKSVTRARDVYRALGRTNRVVHRVFEGPHDYSQPMREAMAGWMTLALKNEGKGDPIPEGVLTLETPEDLACYPTAKARPKSFLTPPLLAGRLASGRVAELDRVLTPAHTQAWEATSISLRDQFARLLSVGKSPARPVAETGRRVTEGTTAFVPVTLAGEAGPVPVLLHALPNRIAAGEPVVVLHTGGKSAAVADPLVRELVRKGKLVIAPDLRGTGELAPKADAIAGAPDHNSAEHALWVGRPLLGQWVTDVRTVLDWLNQSPGALRNLHLVGVGPASLLALAVAALEPARVPAVTVTGVAHTWATDAPYPAGTPMANLVPNALSLLDVPHLAALCAPRPVTLIDTVAPAGGRLSLDAVARAWGFPAGVYRLLGADRRLRVLTRPNLVDVVDGM